MVIGDVVNYVDPKGQEHLALVTQVWGDEDPSLNLVYVSPDTAETDQYGRQIKRVTSVVHISKQYAQGSFWAPLSVLKVPVVT